jgi:hypothetical protein
VTVRREGRNYTAYLRYRDFSGRGHGLKRSGKSKAEASRAVVREVRARLGGAADEEFGARTQLALVADRWLIMFDGLVERGARSPSTRDKYGYIVSSLIKPEIGSLRLGELTAPQLDRFVQSVLEGKGYATAKLTRSVLSGICAWLVRRGALATNPVRDLTPLELDRDRAAVP